MNYSTTYIAEIVKLISVFGLLLGFQVNIEDLTVIIGLLLTIGSSAYTLYMRYKAGGVYSFGLRK